MNEATPELLAPAKDLECGLAAIDCGADAVYIGAERFGARADAGNMLDDIAALVEHVGLPLQALVAHDWGGAVAWSFAVQHPDKLRRLVIINSPHPATFLRELQHSPAQQAASAYMNFLCRPDAEALLAQDDFARLLPQLFQGGCPGAFDLFVRAPPQGQNLFARLLDRLLVVALGALILASYGY